jgi:hypothetical protein
MGSCPEGDQNLPVTGFGIANEELISLAGQLMMFPHYKNNPKVPSSDQLVKLFRDSY